MSRISMTRNVSEQAAYYLFIHRKYNMIYSGWIITTCPHTTISFHSFTTYEIHLNMIDLVCYIYYHRVWWNAQKWLIALDWLGEWDSYRCFRSTNYTTLKTSLWVVLFLAESLWHSHAPYLSGNSLPVARLYPFLCGQAAPSPPTKPGVQKNNTKVNPVDISVIFIEENILQTTHNLKYSLKC